MQQMNPPSLPEGHKHHQFDTEELAHGPDGSQLFFESSVQQHQTIHGKLGRERQREKYTFPSPGIYKWHYYCLVTFQRKGDCNNIKWM